MNYSVQRSKGNKNNKKMISDVLFYDISGFTFSARDKRNET